jgi:hypothetical protein
MSRVYDALHKVEKEVKAAKLTPGDNLDFRSDLEPGLQDAPGAVSHDPSILGANILHATEGLFDNAKASILSVVRGLTQEIETGMEQYRSESQRRMTEFQEAGFRQLKARINEELARQGEICLGQLREKTSNMVGEMIAKLRVEAEETTQATRDVLSKQTEQVTATLSEHLERFRTSAKVNSQEGLDSFRKQMELLASETLDRSQQAVNAVLEDLRARISRAADIFKSS